MLVGDRVSPCYPSWRETCYVVQIVLELRDLPASDIQVQVCAVMSSTKELLLVFNYV